MRFRSNSLMVLACCGFVAGSVLTEAALAGGGIEPLTTVRVISGLSRPVFVTHAPGDFSRIFIIEQVGRIRIKDLNEAHTPLMTFLDINPIVGGGNDERGLLGLAFHPDYQSNGYFYVNYTNNSNNTTIRRYTVSANPNVANAGSGLTLLTINQPFINHNGGWIGFSPNDGYLYIGMGDGGSGNDPGGRGQDITNNLLGKILRIDVDGNNGPGGNYGNPPSNPFVGITGDDEIWAFGIRNPWRASFDRDTGDLYIGDVGQGAREEVNIQSGNGNVVGGRNYGWRCMEGNNCTGLSGCTCNSIQLTDPVWDYSHAFGCSVTGGYVYRGCDIPTLNGTYFYADYCSSRIWSFLWNGHGIENQTERTSELDPPGALSISSISSFGEDARGEIYICDLFGGEVFKIVPVTPTVDTTGDLDGDCKVSISDLLLLFASWGPCDDCISYCNADINNDCTVNTSDLLDLFANWG